MPLRRTLPLLAALLAGSPLAHAATSLVYCSEASPAGFDPAQYTSGTEFDASAETVFNRLVQFKRGSTELEPGLASAWEVSPDGLRYTFHLRDGVQFHHTAWFTPSRPFNADDVLFTFNRLRDPAQPFNKAYPAQFPYFTDMDLGSTIAGLEAPDAHTVVFTLNHPDAAFAADLAMSFASIQSAEYANQLLAAGKAAQLNQLPVGTGPFVFRRYQKDAVIRFDGNTAYWKPEDVKLDHLIFAITPDPATRLQKLKANECQVSGYARPADLLEMKQNPALKVLEQPGFNVGFLAYNTQHPPLNDVRVRQALDMAIDKQAVVDTVFQGAGQVAQNVLPPGQWSYDSTLKGAPYDPKKAKALLAAAGVKAGTVINLWAMTVQRASNPNARLAAQMIQQDWAKVGITANIVSYEWGEYIKRAKAGEHDVLTYGWTGDNGDPDNWLGVLYSCASIGGSNYARWCDKPFDALIEQARHSSDTAERTRLYQQAQRIVHDQVPVSPMAHSRVSQPMRKEVEGFAINPFGLTGFYGVSVAR